MLAAARNEQNDQPAHALRLARICALALAACSDRASTVDAQPCMQTAEPHDEDGDGVYDECDNCPAIANADQADTTEQDMLAFPDLVGDACDLRPGLGGDTLLRFYTFAAETQATEWSGTGFSISDDALHTAASAQWTRVRAATGDGLAAFAQIASMTLNIDTEFMIELDGSTAGGGSACVLAAESLTARESSGNVMVIPIAPAILPDVPFTLIAWRSIVLVQGLRVARFTCRMIREDRTEATVTLPDDLVSGNVTLSSTSATADISSLSVYTSPGPKTP